MKAWVFRILFYGIPALVLAASITAMNMGTVLKRPMGDGDNFESKLHMVSELTQAKKWEEAEVAVQELNSAWDKVRGRVRFMSDSGEIENLDQELAGLMGAVEARSEEQVRIAHRRLIAMWNDLAS